MVGQGGGEEARGGGVRGVVVGAGRNRASVDVEGDAQRRSLGNDETSLALQVGVEGSAAKAERCVRGRLRLPSNGSEELGRLTVGLNEEEARERAVHATGCARDKGDERNGVIVSVLSAVGVDFLGSTLLQGSIDVEGCGVVEGAIQMKLPTAPVALVRLLKVGDESAGARCIGEVPDELDVSTLLSATVG